jgi:hypothetical protein
MFEEISSAAERLAANVSESRRGFFGRVGQAALAVAAVFGGLLALPTDARAGWPTRPPRRYCEVYSLYGTRTMTGYCVCADGCARVWNPRECSPNTGVPSTSAYVCGSLVTPYHACHCS